MQAKDRRLLSRLAVAFLVAWFCGDIVLNIALRSGESDAQREAADLARANKNRQLVGRTSLQRPVPRHGLMELRSFHIKAAPLLRFVGAAGLLLLVAFGPVGMLFKPQNRRALFATALILVSISLFAIAEFVVDRSSTTVMQSRSFTAAELEEDRSQRTLMDPPLHLDPNPRPTGTLRSITFGSDRSEQIAVPQVPESLRDQLDVIRLLAGIFAAVGGIYVLFLFLGPLNCEHAIPSCSAGNPGPKCNEIPAPDAELYSPMSGDFSAPDISDEEIDQIVASLRKDESV